MLKQKFEASIAALTRLSLPVEAFQNFSTNIVKFCQNLHELPLRGPTGPRRSRLVMIYGRKWVPEMFQSRFAPGFDIFTHLEAILRKFKKIDFFKFFICGFTKNRPVEISTGPEISKRHQKSVQNTKIYFKIKMPTLIRPRST